VRLFVAIFPPLEVREALHRIPARSIDRKKVRLTEPENVHITLKFLGEVDENRLAEIREALAGVCERHGPFRAATSGLGAFPSARRARILWAGIGEGSEELSALAADVEEVMERRGFEREPRSFTPHLTLGRARKRPFVLTPGDAPPESPGFRVERVQLVRSVLRREGAAYATLEDYALKGGAARTARG